MPKVIETLEDGVEIVEYSPEELAEAERDRDMRDTTDQSIERMARGFILGSESKTRRRDIRAQLEDRVVKRIGAKGKMLTDKLFELIEGVYIVEGSGKNQVRYYKVPPNLQAIIYALDRVLGKPKQEREKEAEKKGVFVVESIIKKLAGGGVETTTKKKVVVSSGV